MLADPGQRGPDEDPEDWHERTDRQRDHTGRAHRTPTATGEPASPAADESLVAEELLVEEVSIDGMCGVY